MNRYTHAFLLLCAQGLVGCEVADVDDIAPIDADEDRAAPFPFPQPIPEIASSPHISGHSQYLLVASDGSVSSGQHRSQLTNHTHLVVRGREDNDLVFYDRIDGVLRTGTLHDAGGWESKETIDGVSKRWDDVVRGNFFGGGTVELAFYDRAQGMLSVRSLQAGLPEVAAPTIGTTWTGIAVGRWGSGSMDELALYDHARGRLRFVRPGSNGVFTQVAEVEGLPHNVEHVFAVRLRGAAAEPSIVLHDVDMGIAWVYDVDSQYTVEQAQELAWPRGEAILDVPGRFDGNESDDVLVYDGATGEVEIWAPDANGALGLLRTDTWSPDWTHVLSVAQPDSTNTDLYLYSNMVTVLIDFVRYNDDLGSRNIVFDEFAAEDERGPARTIAWLNETYRPAGIRFELGDMHEVRNTVLTTNGFCANATPLFDEEQRKYGSWLSRSSCVGCVESEAPGCGWGHAAAGQTSCDDVALGACASACPLMDWSLCTDTVNGCFSQSMSPELAEYCSHSCPSRDADRVLMSVFHFGGAGGCSWRMNDTVFMNQGGYDYQWFTTHEVGHYFGLGHVHRDAAPTTPDPWAYKSGWTAPWDAIESIDDVVGMFHAMYFDVLGVPGACDDDGTIEIPDSGTCLVPHGANGCTKRSCQDCVDALRNSCFTASNEPGSGSWDASCVAIANNECAAQCETQATYAFTPERHNPMAYGSRVCSEQNEVFKLSASQLRRVREHLFLTRPGLIVPTPILAQACFPLHCLPPRVGVDTNWDGCRDTCECMPLTCGAGMHATDGNGDGCDDTCVACDGPVCSGGRPSIDLDGDGCTDLCGPPLPFPQPKPWP